MMQGNNVVFLVELILSSIMPFHSIAQVIIFKGARIRSDLFHGFLNILTLFVAGAVRLELFVQQYFGTSSNKCPKCKYAHDIGIRNLKFMTDSK